jgi:hypothetical protein
LCAALSAIVPKRLAVVIPSSTPVGTGAITASYGGQTSAPYR